MQLAQAHRKYRLATGAGASSPEPRAHAGAGGERVKWSMAATDRPNLCVSCGNELTIKRIRERKLYLRKLAKKNRVPRFGPFCSSQCSSDVISSTLSSELRELQLHTPIK